MAPHEIRAITSAAETVVQPLPRVRHIAIFVVHILKDLVLSALALISLSPGTNKLQPPLTSRFHPTKVTRQMLLELTVFSCIGSDEDCGLFVFKFVY